MVTVRVCSKLKTSRKLVVFTDIVGKNSRYLVGVFNKTIIPLARVGDKLIIAKTNSALRASLAITISYPMRTRGIIANYAALLSNWEITYEWQNHSVKNHNCNPFCTFFVMIPFLIFSTASECLLLSKVNVDLGWRSLIRICSFRLPMCSLRRFISSRLIYLKLDNQLSCIYNFPYWPSTKFCFHHECSFQSLQWQFAWHVLWVEQLTAEAKTDLSAGGFLLMPTCSLYPLRYNIEWGSTSVGRPNLKWFEQILLFAFTAYIV